MIGGVAVLVGFAAVAVSQRDRLNELANYYNAPFAGCLFEVNQHSVHPYHVALAAASLGVLALLLRRVTGRTRAGLPLFALLLAAGAAGSYDYEHSPREVGSPERWVQDNVVDRVGGWMAGHGGQPAMPVAAPATAPAEDVKTSEPTTSPAAADKAASTGHKSPLFGL